MLYAGLNAFQAERLTLGGGASRGLGVVKLTLQPPKYFSRTHLTDFLTDPAYEGESAQPKDWLDAFRKKLKDTFPDQTNDTGGGDA